MLSLDRDFALSNRTVKDLPGQSSFVN